MAFDRNRIRLALELTKPLLNSMDIFAGTNPKMPVSRAVQFEVALFSNGSLDALTSITSLKLEVKTMTGGIVDAASSPVMLKTVSAGAFNLALTQAAWDAGAPSDAHAVFQFDYTETGLTTDTSTNFRDYGLIITGQTTVGPVDIGIATLRVTNSGGLTVLTPPVIGDPTYVRTDDYAADKAGFIRVINGADVSITLVNDLGYGVRLSAKDGTTQPTLKIDIVSPPA